MADRSVGQWPVGWAERSPSPLAVPDAEHWAAALGGTVVVDRTPGKGTTLSVECPVVE